MTAIRLAHFSDLHLTASVVGWRGRDLLTKRVTGWVNLRMLGRGATFREATAIATHLTRELRSRGYDRLVFSGDATTMAFEPEMAAAAACLGVDLPDTPPGLAVPGNHDYYTAVAVEHRLFEQHFARWQEGERIDGEPYPFAQQVGDLWLVAVNSCKANALPQDASGRVGGPQLIRLGRLLARLNGVKLLVTHYPVLTAAGLPEERWHALSDWRETVAVATAGGVSAWLHGHHHGAYVLKPSSMVPFAVLCAGSATQSNRWSYNEYVIRGRVMEVLRRTFDPTAGGFADRDRFELDL